MEMLDILDESGKIIGQASRDEIHTKGLLHAEVHVWFYTPRGTVIFQHRAKEKDTYPDKLDATAGGHVEIGDSYEESAVKETLEETGVTIESKSLTEIELTVQQTFDKATGKTNNYRRQVYAYRYRGLVDDLEVEEGESQGFEEWPFEKLFSLNDEEKTRFIPSTIDAHGLGILRKIQNLPRF